MKLVAGRSVGWQLSVESLRHVEEHGVAHQIGYQVPCWAAEVTFRSHKDGCCSERFSMWRRVGAGISRVGRELRKDM